MQRFLAALMTGAHIEAMQFLPLRNLRTPNRSAQLLNIL